MIIENIAGHKTDRCLDTFETTLVLALTFQIKTFDISRQTKPSNVKLIKYHKPIDEPSHNSVFEPKSERISLFTSKIA